MGKKDSLPPSTCRIAFLPNLSVSVARYFGRRFLDLWISSSWTVLGLCVLRGQLFLGFGGTVWGSTAKTPVQFWSWVVAQGLGIHCENPRAEELSGAVLVKYLPSGCRRLPLGALDFFRGPLWRGDRGHWRFHGFHLRAGRFIWISTAPSTFRRAQLRGLASSFAALKFGRGWTFSARGRSDKEL